MLLGNCTRDSRNPLKLWGAAAPAGERNNFGRSGELSNFAAGQAVVSAETPKASIPSGYRHPYTWLMPQKAGGIGSRYDIAALGLLAANGALGKNADASLDGVATLDGVGQLVVSAIADITASGAVSGNVLAALVAAADLVGSGDIAGALGALGWVLSGLSGNATITVTPFATGTLAADINVAMIAELTTVSIAEEILDIQLVETGLTVRETLRLCVAALAGKVSGAGGTTITIRSAVADDADRIIATVDNDGNRSAITYDVG